jgi:hypothetical protein
MHNSPPPRRVQVINDRTGHMAPASTRRLALAMSDVRGNSRYVSHQKTIKAFCRRARIPGSDSQF